MVADTTKKVSELVRGDVGRRVRYEPDEDTRDTGSISWVSHMPQQSTLTLDGTSHGVTDPEAIVTFLD